MTAVQSVYLASPHVRHFQVGMQKEVEVEGEVNAGIVYAYVEVKLFLSQDKSIREPKPVKSEAKRIWLIWIIMKEYLLSYQNSLIVIHNFFRRYLKKKQPLSITASRLHRQKIVKLALYIVIDEGCLFSLIPKTQRSGNKLVLIWMSSSRNFWRVEVSKSLEERGLNVHSIQLCFRPMTHFLKGTTILTDNSTGIAYTRCPWGKISPPHLHSEASLAASPHSMWRCGQSHAEGRKPKLRIGLGVREKSEIR